SSPAGSLRALRRRRGTELRPGFLRDAMRFRHASDLGSRQMSLALAQQPSILRTPESRATSIELFAGGGGLALAVHQAGFRHVLVNELDNRACQTLRANYAY